MNLKHPITATFLALVMPAYAQDDEQNGAYRVTKSCAEESLLEVVSPYMEITPTEQGVDGFIETKMADVSSVVVIDQNTSLIKSVDITIDPHDPELGEKTYTKLTYGAEGEGQLEQSSPGTILGDTALEYVLQTDDRMRQCKDAVLLGSLNRPSPLNFG